MVFMSTAPPLTLSFVCFAQIQNDLHAVFNHCDVYNKNNTGINSLTCQLVTGHDNYARIITWGIFQEKTNPNNIIIFTSTHHALNTLADQTTQQKQLKPQKHNKPQGFACDQPHPL